MLTSAVRRWAFRIAGLASCLGIATCGGDNGPSGAPGLNLSPSSVSFQADFGTLPDDQDVTITTTGDQVTGLETSISFGGSQSGWLTTAFDTDQASSTAAATLTFTVTRADLPPGSHTATATISGDNAGNSPTVAITIQVAATTAARMVFTTAPPGAVQSGEPFIQAPVVQLQNEAGDPVAVEGYQVTVALQGGPALGGTATVGTDAAGAATFADLSITGLAGPRTLVFTAPGIPEISSPVTVEPGDPSLIAAISNQAQNAQAGARVDEPPAVRVTDAGGNPVAGVEVTFEVLAGGGTIGPEGAVTTDASGEAALEFWELGDVAGPNTVTATAGGLTGSPVEFNASGTAGAAAELEIVSPEMLLAPVGTTIAHRVRVVDAGGNGIPGFTVQWEATGGGGAVSATTSQTNDIGVAETARTLGPDPGTNTTVASATINGTLRTITFTVVTQVGGPARTEEVSGNNQVGTVGQILALPLQVRVVDAGGVPQPGITVTWVVTIGDGSFPSSPDPLQTTSVTDGSGIASITWRLGNTAGAQRVRASAAGDAVVPFNATANADAPSSATTTLVASPTSIEAGSSSTITATVRDQFSNLVGGANVTLSSNQTGTFGDATLETGTTGTGLGKASTSYTPTVSGNHTITAQIGSFNKTVVIEVETGGAANMAALTSLTGTASFGNPIPVLPAVLVTDASDNPVADVPVTWQLIRGKGTVSTSVPTNSEGVSTVSWTLAALTATRDPAFAVVNEVRASAAVASGSPVSFTRTVQVSFANVQALFGADPTPDADLGDEEFCLGSGCHVGPLVLDLRPDESFDDLTGVGGGTDYVQEGDSLTATNDQNRLLFRLKGLGAQPMPTTTRGGTLPANIITIIAAWIAQGAPGP